MYRVSWIYRLLGEDHEVHQVEAATRDDLMAGVAAALRKGRIKPSHEVRILQCPDRDDADDLVDDVEHVMQQVGPTETK
jgi:hypothetical protein